MGGGQSVSSAHFAQSMRAATNARDKAKEEEGGKKKTVKV